MTEAPAKLAWKLWKKGPFNGLKSVIGCLIKKP